MLRMYFLCNIINYCATRGCNVIVHNSLCEIRHLGIENGAFKVQER